MNQGKKPGARRSAPPKTQNRRVLGALHGTICGAIRRSAAAPAGGLREAGAAAGRCGSPASGGDTGAFIVVPLPQQALPDRRAAPARCARSCARIEPVCVDLARAAVAAGKQANRPIRAAAALAE
ncbi:hypothetical protein CN645_16650 [Burkholderia sp. IDO3]|nr:hypothetical protein DCN14_35115 [Burkholderia sp. IDO3]PCD60743.1 hypothetical protein CN645_16650 [Burkholderia sp. IDO3]